MRDLLQVIGLVLALPGALVAYHDYRERRGRGSPSARATPSTRAARAAGYTAGPRVAPPPPPEPVSAWGEQPEPLGLWRRWFSIMVDAYVAMFVASTAFASSDPYAPVTDAQAVGFLVLLLVMVGVHVWMSSTSGRSLGRLVVGGRLVTVDSGGTEPPRVGTVVGRLLVAVLTSFFAVNVLSGLLDPDRRTFHDRASGTRVVRARRSVEPAVFVPPAAPGRAADAVAWERDA